MRKLILLSLAFALVTLAGLARPERAVAACSATCPGNTSISCNGSYTCKTFYAPHYYIDCDGFTRDCPCTISTVCPAPYKPWRITCSSLSGYCSKTSTSVTCSGRTITCQQCESGQINCQRLADP